MMLSLRTILCENQLVTGILYRASSNLAYGPYCYNRNPRNLERLTIAHKPNGYHLEKPGKSYWNKVVLVYNRSSRSVTGQVVHNSGNVVVTASTNEWAIAKGLYSQNDIAAHINLARVLAQRCTETGITDVACFLERKPETKVDAFLSELEKEGVGLTEAPQYIDPKPSDPFRPEKPWKVY